MKDIEINGKYIIRSMPHSYHLIELSKYGAGKQEGEIKETVLSYHVSIRGALERLLEHNIKISNKELLGAVAESVDMIKKAQEQLTQNMTLTISL